MHPGIDPEAKQREIYQRAGLTADEPTWMLQLAERLGIWVVLVSGATFAGDARLVWYEEEAVWAVEIRHPLPLFRRRWALAHEIAEWHLWTAYGVPYLEDSCNRVAAALVAPYRPFREQLRRVRRYDFRQLGLPFGLDETAAALRVAESTGERLMVVAPHRVYGRGEYLLPEHLARKAAALELPGAYAQRPARFLGLGLRKARLKTGRVVLILDEDSG